MKLFTFAIILFLAYRIIIKPMLVRSFGQEEQRPLTDRREDIYSSKRSTPVANKRAADEGEYVDYEEVD